MSPREIYISEKVHLENMTDRGSTDVISVSIDETTTLPESGKYVSQKPNILRLRGGSDSQSNVDPSESHARASQSNVAADTMQEPDPSNEIAEDWEEAPPVAAVPQGGHQQDLFSTLGQTPINLTVLYEDQAGPSNVAPNNPLAFLKDIVLKLVNKVNKYADRLRRLGVEDPDKEDEEEINEEQPAFTINLNVPKVQGGPCDPPNDYDDLLGRLAAQIMAQYDEQEANYVSPQQIAQGPEIDYQAEEAANLGALDYFASLMQACAPNMLGPLLGDAQHNEPLGNDAVYYGG